MRHCFRTSVERARAGDPTCWIGVSIIVRHAVTMMLYMATARGAHRDRSRRRATTTRPSQMAAGNFSKRGAAPDRQVHIDGAAFRIVGDLIASSVRGRFPLRRG
jgi:hypothetical protein